VKFKPRVEVGQAETNVPTYVVECDPTLSDEPSDEPLGRAQILSGLRN